jgi:hypothetical protein
MATLAGREIPFLGHYHDSVNKKDMYRNLIIQRIEPCDWPQTEKSGIF